MVVFSFGDEPYHLVLVSLTDVIVFVKAALLMFPFRSVSEMASCLVNYINFFQRGIPGVELLLQGSDCFLLWIRTNNSDLVAWRVSLLLERLSGRL